MNHCKRQPVGEHFGRTEALILFLAACLQFGKLLLFLSLFCFCFFVFFASVRLRSLMANAGIPCKLLNPIVEAGFDALGGKEISVLPHQPQANNSNIRV